jgi:hypothetical protein
VLPPGSHHPPSPKRREERHYRFPYDANPVDALISTSGDYENVAGFHDLPHAKPRFGSRFRLNGRWQQFTKVERAILAERRLVKRLPETLQGWST